MTQYDISVTSKPSILVNTTTSTYTEAASQGSITLLDVILAVDNASLKTEASFILDGTTTPTNPNPAVSAEASVGFTGTITALAGKFLGFRLVSATASTDFAFSTSSPLFDAADSKTVAAAESPTDGTIIWTAAALSATLSTLDPLPILIKCASTDFATITTNPLTYTIELYVADALTPAISNLLKLGEVTQTDAAAPLTVSAVNGDVDTVITSYNPTSLAALKTSFSKDNAIAIKAVITKVDTSKDLTNLEFAIAIPSLAVDYATNGRIYISKEDNATAITDFGTTIIADKYYDTALAADSAGIVLTTDTTNGIITVTLSSLPTDAAAKFIDGTTGVVVSPLYVFITGTVK